MKIKLLKTAFIGLVLSVSTFANAGMITTTETYYEFGDKTTDQNGFNWEFDALDSTISMLTLSINWERMDFSDSEYMNIFAEGSFLGRIGGGNSTECHATPTGFHHDCSGSKEFVLTDAQLWSDSALSLTSTQKNVDSSGGVDSPFGFVSATVSYASVPAPSTMAIFALSLMGLASRKFNKKS